MQSLGRFGMDTSSTKKRMLLILELLYKTTDESHPVSTVEIMDYLAGKGFQIDRKTLRSDLRLLISMGYDIVVVKSSPNKYFWGERTIRDTGAENATGCSVVGKVHIGNEKQTAHKKDHVTGRYAAARAAEKACACHRKNESR